MNINPKMFDYELTTHHSFRPTQSGVIDKIIMIFKYVRFVSKKNPSESFKAFHYLEKVFLFHSAVTLKLF